MIFFLIKTVDVPGKAINTTFMDNGKTASDVKGRHDQRGRYHQESNHD